MTLREINLLRERIDRGMPLRPGDLEAVSNILDTLPTLLECFDLTEAAWEDFIASSSEQIESFDPDCLDAMTRAIADFKAEVDDLTGSNNDARLAAAALAKAGSLS